MRTIINIFTDEKGTTAIEYSLISSLIAVVIVAAVAAVSGAVLKLFEQVANGFP